MSAFVTGGAGFLLAVLWFDLMFDVQVLRHHDRCLPEDVLASIAAYYRRVTTEARPMNRLVAVAMLATVTAIVAQSRADSGPGWLSWTSLGLACGPVLLAALRTVPTAVRLGGRVDPPELQSRQARQVCAQHMLCLASIACLLGVQLAWGR